MKLKSIISKKLVIDYKKFFTGKEDYFSIIRINLEIMKKKIIKKNNVIFFFFKYKIQIFYNLNF